MLIKCFIKKKNHERKKMKKRFEGRKVKKMNGLKSEKIQISNS